MKKLLLIFLCFSLLFNSCKKEEDSNNSTNGSILDVVGIWDYVGDYDATGNFEPFNNSDVEICHLQSFITLQSDGNAIMTWYALDDEVSGPCVSTTNAFTFTYINSTTLQFIVPSTCGNATITISPSGLKWPDCNADTGGYDADYKLFEKQP